MSDRRSFLKQVTGLTAAAVAAPALAQRAPEERLGFEAAARVRAFAAAKFALELDGAFAGWLDSVEGGQATADVVAEKLGTDFRYQKKHLGGIKYADITLTCGTGMNKAFYEWLAASFDVIRPGPRKSGAIVATDFQAQERERLAFRNALVAQLDLPALDASSRAPAQLTVTLTPESTERSVGHKGTVGFPTQADKWRSSDFRLTIDGLTDATSRALKIDAISLRQKIAIDAVGQSRDVRPVDGGLDFSNVAVTVADSHAQSFYDWFQDFAIKGNAGDAQERAGTLDYLDVHQTPVFSIRFQNLGIFEVAADKVTTADALRSDKASFYVERIDLKYSVGWSG
jgi:phage tail-like protein